MLQYPLPPVLARLLVAGDTFGCTAEMVAIAALLQGESIALSTGLSNTLHHEEDYTDFQAEWRALQTAASLNYNPQECSKWGIMARAAREITQAFRQMQKLPGQEPDFSAHRQGIVRSLLDSFPTHVAVRNNTATTTARLCNRRGGNIAADSVARHAEIFLAAEITEAGGKTVETRLNRCTIITAEELSTREDDIAVYAPIRKRVLNHRRLLYRDLVLQEQECLNLHAPKSIKLPNGREVKLLYREDGTPTFGLKCQQLFGVPHTPSIATGRVRCLVEILAPNQRPYQITADLASFWKNGYLQMKKDLAGRYPRHDWPTTAPDA